MKILIENYRGWDIYFNTDKESFYAESNEYDNQQEKKSYASAKKFIDDFIKDNVTFTPFFIYKEYDQKPIKVVGIRKDKRFVYEGAKGLEQLSEWSEKDYFLTNEKNEPIFDKINKLLKNREELDTTIKDARKELVKEYITSIKEKYTL